MHIGVVGHSLDDPSDPFVIVGSVLDRPTLVGPISKDRREDMQLWSALEAMGLSGKARHPLGSRVGADPPDRHLLHGAREWGTELTELTVEHVRRELAPVRQFGRKVQERLRARPSDFAHLKGRIVTLTKNDGLPLPRRDDQLLTVVEAALGKDNGSIGEGLNLSQGLPPQLGTRGFYGDHGGFNIVVQEGANAGVGAADIIVSTSSQAQVKQSETIASLGERIAAKDEPGNEIVIVTCGMVDGKGYTCPSDGIIFQFLRDLQNSGTKILTQQPTYIKGVLIHLWATPFLLHWEIGVDVPWLT